MPDRQPQAGSEGEGYYSQASRELEILEEEEEEAGEGEGEEEEGAILMKVWLMVLTDMPNSSTSARRQSKKAWTACLEAASWM